ncbi:hypothetical protein QFZ23_002364 [Arthrobacter globiformis]|uniref:hypothetical protein n=1 Tax=Arthrobacter globiformis TaxID=1665 RepID=UPI00278A4CD2|nr:hypothetical protein [Arthrobacter globiformis]MDQ1058463.1 hypothetical protein [Arthrobacter globiformis]
METAIPDDLKIDGVAEVTFQSVLSPLQGRKQTALAYKDEVNVFRRTVLYATRRKSSRWYDGATPAETVGSRVVIFHRIFLRRRHGVRGSAFHKFTNKQLVHALGEPAC